MRPPASPSCRLYEPEAVGAIGAYPPACKPKAQTPTGWKRPRREVGRWRAESAGSQNSRRHTQTHTDIFLSKIELSVLVCVCLWSNI